MGATLLQSGIMHSGGAAMIRVTVSRVVLCTVVVIGMVSLCTVAFGTVPTGMNIVLIESDSMDGRVMGCAGHPAAYTPNMDAIATRGVLFNNAYCNSPQCCPSRASMRSGRHNHQIEAWNNAKGLEDDSSTFQVRLRKGGYRAPAFGKVDFLSGRHSLSARINAWTRAADIRVPHKKRPWSTVNEENVKRSHRDWKTIDQTVDWLKQNACKSDQPFLLYCGTNIPHPEFRTSKYWYEKINPAKVTLPPYEKKLHPVMEYMSITKNTYGKFSREEILEIRRTYFAMVAETDAMVGEIMRTIDELGLTNSTWFIYTSDHGEMNMEHRQQLKNAMYEGSVRVPLIIAGPGVKNGLVVDDPVSLIDIYPTLMDMAGLDHPDWLDGHSLMPLMKGEPSDRPDWVLSQYHSNMANTGIFMLRRGPWKYIAYAGYDPQLFNLKTDPDELTDLAGTRRDVVRDMDAKLRQLVDYEAVDAKAKAYDKASFRKWRAGLTPEEYQSTMARIYKFGPWNPEHERQLDKWLNEP